MTIQEYNDIYKNPIVKSMEITSSGGVTITNTNICMEQMSLEESLCSENSLVFGACESGCFKIRIADLNHNFEGEWLTVNQLVAIDDGGCLLKEDGSYLLTEDGDRISLGAHDNAIPYGRFKVFSDKPTNDRRWRDLTCYDAMYDILNAEVIEWYNGLTFPMTMKNFRDSFFTYLGITQETTTLVNDSFMIQGGFSNEGSLSGKTIITSICELNGVFGHISRQGQFEYISLPSADSLTLDWYMDGTGAYEDYTVQKITGITAKSSEEDVGTTVGTDTNVYIVQDNPLIYGSEGTQGLTTALTNLLNNVKDITYRPFNVNTYGNPMLPLGTNLTISTRNQTINSFLMTRVLSGIQSLKDSISAKGEQYVPSQVNSLRTETKRTKGKIHELVNNVDELRSTISDLDERVASEIQQLADTIVLKVDANGNIVKVELSANPSTGSTFAVNADNISFTAGSVLRFTANNIVIDSTNFDLDAQGNVVCNNLTATNADISGKITSTDGKIGNWNIGQNSIYSRYTIGQASYSAYMISESAKAEIFTQMQNSSFVQRASLKQGFFELGNSSGATMDTLNPMVTINCGIGTNKAYGYINLYDSEYYGGDYSKPITTVTNDGMSISANSTVKTLITKDGFKDTDFSTNRVLISDGNQFIDTSSITTTELGYLSGASSNIQTQLNGKQATITGGATTIVSDNLTASKALVSNANGKVAVSSVTATELGYVSGATSNIQGQIDGLGAKSVSGNPISITDAEAMNANSVVATITPTQTGSGTPSPSNVRPFTGFSEITIETSKKNLLRDGSFSVGSRTVFIGGQSGEDVYETYLKAGTYTLSVYMKDGFSGSISLYGAERNGSQIVIASGSSQGTFTISVNGYYRFWIVASVNINASDVSHFQLEVGNQSTTYEPYQGNTYTVQLGDTYYGGKIDMTRGVLIAEWYGTTLTNVSRYSDHFFYVMVSNAIRYSFNTNNLMCDKFPTANTTNYDRVIVDFQAKIEFYTKEAYSSASDFMAHYGNIQIAWRLATPVEIQLTPTQIELLENNNTIITNASSLDITYQMNSAIGDTASALDGRITSLEDKTVYSTTEKMIGTWIDGKPLYEKVFVAESTGSQLLYIDISSLNVDYIDLVNAVGSNSSYSLSTYTQNGNDFFYPYYDKASHNIVLYFNGAMKPAGTKFYITAKYTKA